LVRGFGGSEVRARHPEPVEGRTGSVAQAEACGYECGELKWGLILPQCPTCSKGEPRLLILRRCFLPPSASRSGGRGLCSLVRLRRVHYTCWLSYCQDLWTRGRRGICPHWWGFGGFSDRPSPPSPSPSRGAGRGGLARLLARSCTSLVSGENLDEGHVSCSRTLLKLPEPRLEPPRIQASLGPHARHAMNSRNTSAIPDIALLRILGSGQSNKMRGTQTVRLPGASLVQATRRLRNCR